MKKIIKQFQKNVDELFIEGSKGRDLPNEFRISELPYCCAKSYYRRKLGIQTKQNAKMFAGNLCHSRLEDLVKGIPEYKEAEFEVECQKQHGKISIMGHCDILTEDCVTEFKFSGSDLAKYPNPIHWMLQVNAYATILEVPKWNIIQLNSRNLVVEMIPGLQNDISYDILLDKAKTIHKALIDNKPPEGPAYPWECYFCTELKDGCKNYVDKMKEKVKK